MKERTIKTYQFDELSDEAKQKARDWLREAMAGDNYFSESVIEDASTIAGLLGIDLKRRGYETQGGHKRYEPCIFWSGFWSQGDGASFEGGLTPNADAVKAVTDHASQDAELARIAAEVAEVAELTKGLLSVSIYKRGHYEHEGTMQFDFSYSDEDYAADTLSDDVRHAAEDKAAEAMRDFARWIYCALQAEYEYQYADEQIDDSIRANEYDFTEDGRRFRL